MIKHVQNTFVYKYRNPFVEDSQLEMIFFLRERGHSNNSDPELIIVLVAVEKQLERTKGKLFIYLFVSYSAHNYDHPINYTFLQFMPTRPRPLKLCVTLKSQLVTSIS